ncbi:hypothetical protein TNCV_3408431 [Trichonephila clavipes]|nr:hypothetical protein TNCV_3408431 [Trichonephila clavipes]
MEECPTEAHLEHVKFPRQEVWEYLTLETAQRIRYMRTYFAIKERWLNLSYCNSSDLDNTLVRKPFENLCFRSTQQVYFRQVTTDFGSPPMPLSAFCEANGDFLDISLLDNDKMRNRECEAISSIVKLGNTRPLPSTADLDPYTQNRFHPGVPTPTTESNEGGSVPVN